MSPVSAWQASTSSLPAMRAVKPSIEARSWRASCSRTNACRPSPSACGSSRAPTNAWIAGGAYSTAQDYAKLLRAFLGGSFIDDMAAFTQSRTSGLPRIFVPAPAASWEYALGSFVECSASTSCATSQINSSPGAYGWLGWIDRENEYYGLIATELASAGDRKSVELEQQMQPLIEAAIASRTPI